MVTFLCISSFLVVFYIPIISEHTAIDFHFQPTAPAKAACTKTFCLHALDYWGCRKKLKSLICAKYMSALEHHFKEKFWEHDEKLETPKPYLLSDIKFASALPVIDIESNTGILKLGTLQLLVCLLKMVFYVEALKESYSTETHYVRFLADLSSTKSFKALKLSFISIRTYIHMFGQRRTNL